MKTGNPKLQCCIKSLSQEEEQKIADTLHKKANRLSMSSSYTNDELYEVGNYAAMEAYWSYLPNRGYQRYSWMVMVGVQHMTKYIQIRNKKDRVHVLMKEGQIFPDLGIRNMDLERSMFMEELKLLSPPALEVVDVLFTVPLKSIRVLEFNKPKKVRGRIRELLKRQGWTDRQISRSFTEIRQFILRKK